MRGDGREPGGRASGSGGLPTQGGWVPVDERRLPSAAADETHVRRADLYPGDERLHPEDQDCTMARAAR